MVSDMDPVVDHDKLVWLHGFITHLLGEIERRAHQNSKAELEGDTALADTRRRLGRILNETEAIPSRHVDEPLDSLEQACADLDSGTDSGADAAPVPSKKIPGPKGRSGGAAEELPN